MVEDIEVRVRVRVPEEDKQEIRNQAQAIRDSDPTARGFGADFEGSQDAGSLGFQSGGAQRLRDRTSRTPVDLNSVFGISQEQQEENELAIQENEKRINLQEKSVSQIISNPQGFVQDKLQNAFRSISFITPLITAAPIIAALIAAPQMIQEMITLLKDNRIIGVFRRDVLNERNPFLSREQQRARLIGERAVIFSNTSGFANSNGNLTVNTLAQVRANGISDIGLRDKAGGLF